MNIGGFQKLTLLDFPGCMAAIVFTRGCNLRCPFCHNSDLISGAKQNTDACEEEILDYLKKRQGILEGVVISGGEPLLNSDIEQFIIKIRNLGYKIKLDTNGTFPDVLKRLINGGLLDYIAMDIKHTLPLYSSAAGVDGSHITENVKKSMEILDSSSVEHEFRTTIVKGIHKPQDIVEIAKFLPQNTPYYLQSYEDSGSIFAPNGLSGYSKEELLNIENLAKAHHTRVCARGV